MQRELASVALDAAHAWLRPQLIAPPEVALILGSGLGALADTVTDGLRTPYARVPHMPTSSVEGHAGNFVFGQIAGRRVVMMQGRVHLYEGHEPGAVVFGARLMRRLGAHTLIVSNAAGGLRADMRPGDLMLITDHLNLTGHNPLRGPDDPALGQRFADMSAAYDPELRARSWQIAQRQGRRLLQGVYAGVLGPSYETPAEIRMLRALGADAVGMSTVLEVIAAHHMGARVVGISCITNLAAGMTTRALTHAEVQDNAQAVRTDLSRLVEALIGELAS